MVRERNLLSLNATNGGWELKDNEAGRIDSHLARRAIPELPRTPVT